MRRRRVGLLSKMALDSGTNFGARALLAVALLHMLAACCPSEAGVTPDAGGSTDAGSLIDAGTPADAGVDAGRVLDGGLDAGRDAGSPVDAGPDGGALVDAGPPDPCLPFAMPPLDTLFGSDRKVFAHYFYPFPLSIDNLASDVDYYNRNYLQPTGESDKWLANGGYLRQRPLPVGPSTSATWQLDNMEAEVRMAMAAGITGFTIDVLGADQLDAGSQLQNLYAAAAAVDSRFKIVVMPDISALGADQPLVQAIIASVANYPAAYRLADGRLVATAFDASLGSVAFWTTILGDLSDAGTNVAFVPTFLGWEGYAAPYAPICYGFADWGTAKPQSSASSEAWPAAAHDAGESFMMPVDPQQYRPKDFSYWEAENSLAFRTAWTSAIDGGADWVQIVTWSDFSESSDIEPYTDATLAPDIGTGFYDLNAYYAAWYLTGAPPQITHDVLYYFYRREPTTAADPAQAQATTLAVGGGTAQNDIELLGLLVAPGTLEIAIGGQTFTQDAPAGLTSFTVASQPGTPQFSLVRDGGAVISFVGGIQVHGDGGLDAGTLDLTYWSGSASAAGTCALTVP
jgi:hypothetical protein